VLFVEAHIDGVFRTLGIYLGTGLVCGALLEWAHIGLRTFCDMKRSSTLTGFSSNGESTQAKAVFMVPRLRLALKFVSRPIDAARKTTGTGIMNVNIGHAGIREEPLDRLGDSRAFDNLGRH
jgi:hypothetical protein